MKPKYILVILAASVGLALATPALAKTVDLQLVQSKLETAAQTQQAWFFYTCSFTYKETIGSYGGVGGGGGGSMTRNRTGYYPSLTACPV